MSGHADEAKVQPVQRAMILAAGEGRRMRPLTINTPKPLLIAHSKPLIVHHIENLVACGIKDIIINLAYLGAKIEQALGNGEKFGVRLRYSYEPKPLETGGALNNALALLGDEPFILVNADVWLPAGFETILAAQDKLSLQTALQKSCCLGVLGLVENPAHNKSGDFAVDSPFVKQKVAGEQAYTFSGVSIIHPRLISTYPKRRQVFALKEVFDWAIAQLTLQAYFMSSNWADIGTPERLSAINANQSDV